MERDLDIAVLAGSVQKALDIHINPRTVQESRDIDRLNSPVKRLDYKRWLVNEPAPSPYPPNYYPQYNQPPQPPPQYQPHPPENYQDNTPFNKPLPSSPEGYIPLHGDLGNHAKKYINGNQPVVLQNEQSSNLSFQNTSFSVPNVQNKQQELDTKAEETIIDNLRREVLELKQINESIVKQLKTLNSKFSKLSKLIEDNLVNHNEEVPS